MHRVLCVGCSASRAAVALHCSAPLAGVRSQRWPDLSSNYFLASAFAAPDLPWRDASLAPVGDTESRGSVEVRGQTRLRGGACDCPLPAGGGVGSSPSSAAMLQPQRHEGELQ